MSSGLDPAGPAVGLPGWLPPRGRHKIPREVVVGNQRARLLRGVALALAERGYSQMTVEHVLEKAGVSRATYYDHFENKLDAVLIAHDEAFERFAGELTKACAVQEKWTAKVRTATAVAIARAVREPEETQLLVLDAVAAEPVLIDRVLAANDFLVGLLRNGREHCPLAAALPELTERALVGAATSVVGTRLIYGQADQLRDLEPQLVQLLLMPYVGIEEAREVAYGGPS